MKFILLSTLLYFIPLSLSARNVKDFAYPKDPKGWSWFPSFYLQGGTFFRYGSMVSSDNSTVEKRSLYGVGADGHVGFVLSGINFGLGGEIGKYYQTTDPNEVSNTNTAGTSKSTYFISGINIKKVSIFAKYYLTSSYEFEYKDSSGQGGALDDPTSSFGIELFYHGDNSFFMGLTYTSMSYEEYEGSSSVINLSNDTSVSLKMYGLVVGYIF